MCSGIIVFLTVPHPLSAKSGDPATAGQVGTGGEAIRVSTKHSVLYLDNLFSKMRNF